MEHPKIHSFADKRPSVLAWGPFPWSVLQHMKSLRESASRGTEIFQFDTSGLDVSQLRPAKVVLISEDLTARETVAELRKKIGNSLLFVVVSFDSGTKPIVDCSHVDGAFALTDEEGLREFIHRGISLALQRDRVNPYRDLVPPVGIEPTS